MTSEEEILAQLRRYQQTERQIGPLRTQLVLPADSQTQCDALVVLMHGYGAPPDDLAGLAVPLLVDCFRNNVRPMLAFPGAPISLQYGGAAWWHLNMERLMEATAKNSFGEMCNEVPPGIDEATGAVGEVIDALFKEYGFEPANLLLGGFSQGAMLAVNVAILGMPTPPAALGILSGALICESKWRSGAGDRLKSTLVFQSHGRQDPILPLQTGEFLNELLTDLCKSVDLHTFNGGHQIPEKSIAGLAAMTGQIS